MKNEKEYEEAIEKAAKILTDAGARHVIIATGWPKEKADEGECRIFVDCVTEFRDHLVMRLTQLKQDENKSSIADKFLKALKKWD